MFDQVCNGEQREVVHSSFFSKASGLLSLMCLSGNHSVTPAILLTISQDHVNLWQLKVSLSANSLPQNVLQAKRRGGAQINENFFYLPSLKKDPLHFYFALNLPSHAIFVDYFLLSRGKSKLFVCQFGQKLLKTLLWKGDCG